MAIVGRAYVELHGRTGQLERDIERALAPSIKRLTKQINTDIGNSITDAFKKVKSTDLDLDVKGVGERAGKRILKELNKTLKEKIKVNLDVDKTSINNNARAITDRIQRRLDQVKFKVKEPFKPKDWKIPVNIDEARLKWVKHQLKDLKQDYSKIEAKVQPNYGSAAGNLVAARLAWLTRARTVSVLPVLQPGSVAAFSAQLLAALSGGRLIKSTLENIRDLFKNVDKQLPKISLITSAISGLSAWIMAALSNIGSLILDVARLAGLLIPLPGILVGMGIGLGVFVAAIIDLNNALPNVIKSFRFMREQISNAFWTQAQSSVGAFFDDIIPQFERGTVKVAGAMGSTIGIFMGSLRKSLSGQLDPMFAQLTRSINISSLATTAFANIITILGQHGADYLPELATWFNRIGVRFSNWLSKVSASGELRMWTDAGIAALHDLGQVLSGIGKIFFGIADAAQKAGASTLQTLGDRLQSIAEIVNSEPFKSRLIGVFQAAHEMMDTIARISGPAVKDFFEDLAAVIDQTFKNLGPAIGNIIKGLASALASPTFIKGFNEFTSGLAEGINAVTQELPAVGRAVGEILPVIGEMARQFGPIIANILRSIADLASGIAPTLIPVIDVLAGLLEIITRIPAPILLTAAAFIYLRGPLSGIGLFLRDITQSLSGFIAQARGTAAIQNVGQQFGIMQTASAGLSIAIGKVGAALKTAFISNAPMLAITALVTVLGHFAMESAEAKRVADELGETLDDTTASFTEATEAWTIQHFSDSIKNARWDNLEELGFSLTDISVAAAQGEDALMNLRDNAQDTLDQMVLDGASASGAWKELVSGDSFSFDSPKASLQEFIDEINRYNSATDTAVATKKREIEAAAALGQSVDGSAAALAIARLEEERSTQVRNIATGAIDAQITSLQTLLALQREAAGETLSYRESMRGLEQSYQDVRDEVAAYLEKNAGNLNAMNITTEAGRDLQEAFDGIVKSTNEAVDAARNHNASQEEITTIVANSRKQFVDYAAAVMGGSDEAKKAAEELADELGLLPENYNFEATVDPTKALFGLNELKVQIDKTTALISIDGNPVPANKTLGEIVGNVNETTGTVEINGDDYPARMTIGEFLSYSGVVEAQVQVGANTSGAFADRQVFVDSTGELKILVPMDVDVETAQESTMTWMDRVAQSVYPQLKVSADTTGITEAVNTATTNAVANPPTINVNGSTTGFQNSVAGAVENVRNTTATINIVGNGSQAAQRRDELVSSINGANATIKIMGDGSNAAKRRKELVDSINSATPTLKILGNGSNAARRRDELVNSINSAVATMKIYADASYARSAVNTFVANTNNRTATVTVYARTVGEFADGGIAAYANGGIRRVEQHNAHIARTIRVFGEPETGGEAYIPLALSKRLRSSKILKQVAEMMGYQIIPRNARTFADGGILSKANVQVVQVPSSNTRIDAIVSQTPEGQTINNYFTINTNGEVDVHTLAREVSREIMYSG